MALYKKEKENLKYIISENTNYDKEVKMTSPIKNLSTYENTTPNHTNLNTNFFHSNTNLHHYSAQNDSFRGEDYDNEETRLKKQLMEKDKIIFEYIRTIKENDRNLDQTKKLVISKDEGLSKVKEELKDLKFKLKSGENQILRKEDEYNRLKNITEEKIVILSKERNELEDKYNHLSKQYDQLQKELQVNKLMIKSANIENKKLDSQISKLQQNMTNNTDIMKNAEKNVEDLRKENKIIPNLKRQIENMQLLIEEIKNDYNSEKEKVDNLTLEKHVFEKRLRELNEITSGENSVDNLKKKLDNTSYQLELKIKENENLEIYGNSIQEKYKSFLKENEIFVNTIANELSNSTNIIDSLNDSNKVFHDEMINCKVINLNKSKFGLKYELINKNFDILKAKIIENHNNSISQIEKLKKNQKDQESKINELVEEKNKLSKENNSKTQISIELGDKLSKLNAEKENFKNLTLNQKDNLINLKKANDDLNNNYDSIYHEYQNFIINTLNQLNSQFSNEDMTSSKKYSKENLKKSNELNEKITEYIDLLIRKISDHQINENELINKINLIQNHNKNLEDERTMLLTRVERITQAKEEELNNLDNSKNEEIKKHRDSLYEKINSLTKLLEESNYMMSEYENENIRLKNKCEKYEYNLQMLTQSHLELETDINSNFNSLKIELDQKDYKFNNLLRELELKEMRIESLENCIKRKEEEIETVKQNQKLYLNTSNKINNFNSNNTESKEDLENQNENEFSKNMNSEIIYQNKGHSRTNSNNFEKNIDFKIGFDSSRLNRINSNSNIIDNYDIRIPGKIYSKKKNFN